LRTADVIVIGGGLSGSAIALGLARERAGRVMIFDEQLPTQRLSRGNFGLAWFMCKGAGHPVYARWCRMACRQWPEFAASLEAETGCAIELEWTGGAVAAFGEREFSAHAQSIENLKAVCARAGLDYPVEMLDRSAFAALIPDIELGSEVTGAMFSAGQGHVNPLKLLSALRRGVRRNGGSYHGDLSVTDIVPISHGRVRIRTSRGDFVCSKLVIAAGHGAARLLSRLGETLHIYPQRGQLMVTERHRRVLKVPVVNVRQTMDGAFLIGLSSENAARDTRVTAEAMKSQAIGAIRLFPMLGRLNWVRSWAAIRVMTPDGAPIYSRVRGHDNITVVALHSAVSLAPLAANLIAPWIAGGREHELIHHFGNGRFHV